MIIAEVYADVGLQYRSGSADPARLLSQRCSFLHRATQTRCVCVMMRSKLCRIVILFELEVKDD